MKSIEFGSISPRSYLLLAGLLVLAVIALYGQSIYNPLMFDDLNQLNSERIFTQYGGNLSIFQVRWVSYGTFALTHKLLGESWVWFRVSNILLHMGTVLAIFWFYRTLYLAVSRDATQRAIGVAPQGLAFAGALLFAVHPTSVYAVAYLLQRSIVMATLFSVLSLGCLLKGMLKSKSGWYFASGLFYVLAVFSKEHSVLILIVALVLVVLVRKPSLRELREFWWVLPIGLAVATALLSYYGDIFGKAFDAVSRNYLDILAKQNPDIHKQAYGLSIMNQGYLFFKYLVLWFFPYPSWMSVDIREIFPVSFFSFPESLGFAAFLIWPVVAIRLFFQGGEKGLFGFGMLFPWLLFLSELAVVWVQDPFVIYRNYLWMAGMPAMLPLLFKRLSRTQGIALLAVVVISAGGVAINRLATFKSELAAWNDAVAYNEDHRDRLGKDRLYVGRGGAYLKSGNAELGLADFKKALELNPAKSDNWLNRGTAYFVMQAYPAAVEDYSKAIELDKTNLKAYFNRAAAYNQMDRDDLAMADLTYVLDNVGELAWSDIYILRSAIYQKQGQLDAALGDLDKAMSKEKGNPQIYINRGNIYLKLARLIDAIQDFDVARSINSKLLDAQFGRGVANFRLGRNSEALADFDNAISMDPAHVKAHLFRSQLYVRLNQIENAMNEYGVVLRLNPNEAQAYLNRGEINAALKNFSGAQKDLSKACELGMQVGCAKLKQLSGSQ